MARSAAAPAPAPPPAAAPASPPHPQLPLTSVNHISFAVPRPQETAAFFQRVLGFARLARPAAFEETFDGAWVCGMGLEIHFIAGAGPRARAARIDPCSDHLSFLSRDAADPAASDFVRVRDTLAQASVPFLERDFPRDNLRQVRLQTRLCELPRTA